jgi:hypothetical protein
MQVTLGEVGSCVSAAAEAFFRRKKIGLLERERLLLLLLVRKNRMSRGGFSVRPGLETGLDEENLISFCV